MFKNILFATDASTVCEIAAKTAFELSEKYGSKLTLLHVDTKFSSRTCPFFLDTLAKKNKLSDPEYIAVVKQGMKKRYDPLMKKEGYMAYCVVEGNPSQEILKFAQKNKVDCIIMGAHAQKDSRGGNTLKRVAHKAVCPVMSIARSCETSFWYFNQIVFGTDFSPAAMSAFHFAYKLADYIGCRMNIFHALEIEPSCTGGIPDQKIIEAQIKEARDRIEQTYVSKMENFDNYAIVVREGNPYIELLKFSRETSGDLIVIAHHAKEVNFEKPLFKSTIDQVLHRSACPVINVNQYSNF